MEPVQDGAAVESTIGADTPVAAAAKAILEAEAPFHITDSDGAVIGAVGRGQVIDALFGGRE